MRNPFDLIVSLFHYKLRLKGEAAPTDVVERKAQFAKFVSGRWGNQSNLLMIDGKICIDRFVRLEHIRTDLQNIVDELGLDLDVSRLPHEKQNLSRSRKLSDYYDAKTVAIVRERMAWIFERFDYATDIEGL